MVFLRAIKQSGLGGDIEQYPLSLPQIAAIDRLSFDTPVTLIAGDNGSGKTTLIEIVAALTKALRIGDDSVDKRAYSAFLSASRAFRPEFSQKPQRSFFFIAEDFTRYIDAREERMRAERADLERIEREYAGRSSYAKSLATLPHASGLHAMETMYSDELSEQSHGEGYIDFFGSRLKPRGLYLMDEPEGALSYYNQFVLMNMIADAVKSNCQFIISTHSPVLLAYPDALLYSFADGGIQKAEYDRLESISFLKSFLAEPERYLRHLGSDD